MNPAQTLTMLSRGAVVAERFCIDALVGAGGMGVIYKARDRVTGKAVALKIMGRCGADGRARFEREAKAIAALSHPGIVKYIDAGQTDDESRFIAMEWVDGDDLSVHLARGPLSVDATLRLAAQVADALACAHRAGLVHRDIKPSNLVLSDADARVVTVVDFGLARAHDLVRDVTMTGSVLGTPGYMAPEQARGAIGAAPSADVFSLGCVLFECLTHRQAFPGGNPVEVLARLLLEDAPSVRRYAPHVPEAVERFIALLLQKEPSCRPANGDEVRAQLDRLDMTSTVLPPTRTDARAVRILEAPAALVWGMLVDTDRWDRLIGAPRTTYTFEADSVERKRWRMGSATLLGIDMRWREVGEWIEGVSMWGERRFVDGPFEHIGIRATTTPMHESDERGARGERCRVDFQAYVKARPGAPDGIEEMMSLQFQKKLGRYLDSLERLFGSASGDELADLGVDASLGATAAARLLVMRADHSDLLSGKAMNRTASIADALDALSAAPVTETVKRELRTLLSQGSREELRAMRPFELARAWGADRRDALKAFLCTTRAGATRLRWLLKCPACRVAASSASSISHIRSHARCEVCQLDFGLDLARNIEAVFDIVDATEDEVASPFYCASSPAFRPHIIASLRLAARGTRVEALRLPDAPLRARALIHRADAPPISSICELSAGDTRSVVWLDIHDGVISQRVLEDRDGVISSSGVHESPVADADPPLGHGITMVHFTTSGDSEVEITLERPVEIDDASVGEDILSFAEFLDHVADDHLAAGVDLPVSRLCVGVLDIDGVDAICDREGDSVGFTKLQAFRSALVDTIHTTGGSTPMILGTRIVTCFEPTSARVEALRILAHELSSSDGDLSVRGALETGTALLVQGVNGPEIFGKVVRAASNMARGASVGVIEIGADLREALQDKKLQLGALSKVTRANRAA